MAIYQGFSKIGRVSTKTLRYYDEIELLKPTHVDQENQYRYYSDEEVYKILFISEMKDYGLKLEEIKVILDKRDISLLKKFTPTPVVVDELKRIAVRGCVILWIDIVK